MSMRYLVRRPNPEDLNDVKAKLPQIEQELGKPDADFKRTVSLQVSPVRSVHYTFLTRKVGTEWKWICSSIEFDCEDKQGLFALCDSYQVPRPGHLH